MKHTHDHALFARPLILGASISAGYGTRDGGIGAVLSRMINPDALIINKAKSGATSVQSTGHLDFDSFTPTVVLGFDLFFWDAVREQTGRRFHENTKRLFDSFQGRQIPMILGRFPSIDLPFGGKITELKKSTQKVNEILQKYQGSTTLLYDPLMCFLSMTSGNYFSDGLHLNDEGNLYCAKFFLESGEHKKLKVA